MQLIVIIYKWPKGGVEQCNTFGRLPLQYQYMHNIDLVPSYSAYTACVSSACTLFGCMSIRADEIT